MTENTENRSQTPMMLINDCSRMFRHQMRKFADDAGVPCGYRELLMHLAFCKSRGQDAPSQYELARHTHLSPPTVSVTLQKMERDGYIVRMPDESDMRQMRVSLTEKGLAVDRANRQKAAEIEEMAANGLSPDEVEELTRLLRILCKNLGDTLAPKPSGKE